MNKVIKITEDEIFIGKEDGSIVKTERANANWDVKLGDKVELYASGKTVIVNLARRVKEKKECKPIIEKFSIFGQKKIFPIILSCLFAVFLIALIVINSVPRGKKYTYKADLDFVYVSMVVEFDDDEVTASGVMEMFGDKDDIIGTNKYKITNGKLYIYQEEEKTYEYAGEISSTELEFEIMDGYTLKCKENTMITLRTISIVFMIIFGLLDAAAITFMILIKKGIIKLPNSKENNDNVELNNVEAEVKE